MKTSEKKIQRMKFLKEKGLNYSQIAREVNCTITTVRYYLVKGEKQRKKNYYKENREKIREYRRKYMEKRYKEDKPFKEKQKERSRDFYRNKYNTDEEFRKKEIQRQRELKGGDK